MPRQRTGARAGESGASPDRRRAPRPPPAGRSAAANGTERAGRSCGARTCASLQGQFTAQVGRHVEQQRHRAGRPRSSSRRRSLDQRRAAGPGSRRRRRARATRRLPGTSRAGRRRGRRNVTSVRATPVRSPPVVEQGEAAEDLVRAAGEALQMSARAWPRRAALPNSSPSRNTSVSTPSTSALGPPAPRPRAPCAARSRRTTSRGCPVGLLLHVGGHDCSNADAELLEDRPPLRRARREDQRSQAARRLADLQLREEQRRSRARRTRPSRSRARG